MRMTLCERVDDCPSASVQHIYFSKDNDEQQQQLWLRSHGPSLSKRNGPSICILVYEYDWKCLEWKVAVVASLPTFFAGRTYWMVPTKARTFCWLVGWSVGLLVCDLFRFCRLDSRYNESLILHDLKLIQIAPFIQTPDASFRGEYSSARDSLPNDQGRRRYFGF